MLFRRALLPPIRKFCFNHRQLLQGQVQRQRQVRRDQLGLLGRLQPRQLQERHEQEGPGIWAPLGSHELPLHLALTTKVAGTSLGYSVKLVQLIRSWLVPKRLRQRLIVHVCCAFTAVYVKASRGGAITVCTIAT